MNMRALSLHQPWLDLILIQQKTVETRIWSTHVRGPVLLCAAKKYDKEVIQNVRDFQKESREGYFQLPLNYYPRLGRALAVVDFVDCVELSEDMENAEEWRRRACLLPHMPLDGLFGFVLENIRAIKPFPVRGSRKFFSVELTKPLEYLPKGELWLSEDVMREEWGTRYG